MLQEAYEREALDKSWKCWLRNDEKKHLAASFKKVQNAVMFNSTLYAMIAAPSGDAGNAGKFDNGYIKKIHGEKWQFGGKSGGKYHGSRQFDFVWVQAGGLNIGKKDDVGHTNLSERAMVKFAGKIAFLDGDDDQNIDNNANIVMTRGSGHYKPTGVNSPQVRGQIQNTWGPGRVGTKGVNWEY